MKKGIFLKNKLIIFNKPKKINIICKKSTKMSILLDGVKKVPIY